MFEARNFAHFLPRDAL